jgi:hypothetical protein
MARQSLSRHCVAALRPPAGYRPQLIPLEERLLLGDTVLGTLLGSWWLAGLADRAGAWATSDPLADRLPSDPGPRPITLLAADTALDRSALTSVPSSPENQIASRTPTDGVAAPDFVTTFGFASVPDWMPLPALATGAARSAGSGSAFGGSSSLAEMGLPVLPAIPARDARLGLTASVAGVHPSGDLPPTARPVPAAGTAVTAPTPAQAPAVRQQYGQLPLSFEANVGQAAAPVQFLAHGAGYSLFLTATEAVMALNPRAGQASQPASMSSQPSTPNLQPTAPGAVVRMQVLGGNVTPRVVGLDPLPGKVNYFLGNDPRQWGTNVATYAKVEYRNVYPGINLDYYSHQGQLEYDFVVAPGADPHVIQLDISGADQMSLNDQGDLVLHVGGQDVVQHKPVVYQQVNGTRQQVASAFVLLDPLTAEPTTTRSLPLTSHQIGFVLGGYDASRPLVIDPVLSYSTYLGGSKGDVGAGIAVDASGNAYLTGGTSSTDFPTVNAFQPILAGTANAFVTKVSADGSTLLYSTYLGGSNGDAGAGIAVDSSGNAYLTGSTTSTDFPTVNAFQPSKGGGVYTDNAFVAEVSADGSSLVYSSYLGGSGYSYYGQGDYGESIAVDAAGEACVTGTTRSTDFPTANALQPTKGGVSYIPTAFVTKVSADGSSLVYSSYLGGSNGDTGAGIAVDAAGNAYLTGSTDSTDFPTANAFQPTNKGYSNAFVTKVSADGSSLVYSSYLGGSGGDHYGGDNGAGIAVDGAGNAYVTGGTSSTDFPTTPGAFQPTNAGGFDNYNAFATKLSADGGSLVYSSYLGGSGYCNLGGCYGDTGAGIAVDGAGSAHVTGSAHSTNFPTAHAFQPTKPGPYYTYNAFITKVSADGSSLVYSSYLGGSGTDSGYGIAVDASGNAYVTGYTTSTDFPTANAFQPFKGGGSNIANAFVTKIVD